MRFLRNYLRFLAAVQLLPALESGEETLVGGQAVLEGVMMRSPHAWAIACRKPSGQVVTLSEPLERPSEKHKWMAWPIMRGVVTLGYAMKLGYRALRFSANVAIEDIMQDEKANRCLLCANSAAHRAGKSLSTQIARESGGHQRLARHREHFAFAGFLHFHVQVPAACGGYRAEKLDPAFGGQIVFNLIDGAVRLVLFLLFIWGVSLWKDIRRVYEYHGAEHKTVFAFENGDPLQIPAVQKYSTFHPRCGTSFLMTVMLISIGFYMLVPFTSFGARFAARIVLLPLIAGVSYEIIRFAAKHRGSLFA